MDTPSRRKIFLRITPRRQGKLIPNYVIDASVVIEYLITGPYSQAARGLFEQISQSDRLIMPEFGLLEATNVLWKQVRFQGMPVEQAEKILRNLKKLPLERVPVKAILNEAFTIGLKYQLAIYDSSYIALAKRTGYPLISIDQPQIRAAASESVNCIPITNFLS